MIQDPKEKRFPLGSRNTFSTSDEAPLPGFMAITALKSDESSPRVANTKANVIEGQQHVSFDWNLPQRIAFRFAFVYFFLYIFPAPLDKIPYISNIAILYQKIWYALVPWMGKHFLRLNLTCLPNGNDDTAFNYTQLLCYLVFAAIVTLVWTLLDPKTKNYQRLHEWLRIYVRYYLAIALLGYGIHKLIPVQFGGSPGLLRLDQPLGEYRPMDLLWTLMAASMAYTMFEGAAETLGGILLFFKRTTTLGALVNAAVMTNAAMLTYCYDVPTKIYSTHLLLMALFLLTPDLQRLANVLVLNRATAPANLEPPYHGQWTRIGAMAAKIVFIFYILFSTTANAIQISKTTIFAPKSPLYGTYEVEDFTKNHQSLPSLTTDPSRWRKLFFQSPDLVSLKTMNNSVIWYGTEFDQSKKTVTFFTHEQRPQKYIFTYSRPDAEHLVLQGTLDSDALVIKTRRVDERILLTHGGPDWMNDHLFSR
jgi:hypothetical protein